MAIHLHLHLHWHLHCRILCRVLRYWINITSIDPVHLGGNPLHAPEATVATLQNPMVGAALDILASSQVPTRSILST